MLYCRKKLGDNLPVLKKSCAACRKAKVKCNSDFPSCRRCVEKKLICVYELTRRSGNSAQQPAFEPSKELRVESTNLGNQNDSPWELTPDEHNGVLTRSDFDSSRDWSAVELDFGCQNELSLDWEPDAGCVEGLEYSDFVTSSVSDSSSNDYSSFHWFPLGPPLSPTLDPTFSTPQDCMFHTPYLVLRPMDLDHQPSSTSLISQRSPFIQAYVSPSSQIGGTFLLQSIQSYATVLATSNLAPFIHSISLPTHGPSLPSSAPLEICKSIVSLYKTKTASTSPFIWRSVTMEKDRFMNELEDADTWTMLAMLQAITVYILLRIFDNDSFSVDFDRELVSTMTVSVLPRPPLQQNRTKTVN